jgi:hypothetical protein
MPRIKRLPTLLCIIDTLLVASGFAEAQVVVTGVAQERSFQESLWSDRNQNTVKYLNRPDFPGDPIT